MIDELDEVLRKLLIRELPITNGEVDIAFQQPSRDWSARVSKPTLNVFLYDVRENQKLRQTQPMWENEKNLDGTITQRRKPVRVDLHYMITAWAMEAEDEHRLISRTLMSLFRISNLPEDLLTDNLKIQNRPIPIMAAQYNELQNPTEFWNVLDNEMRPAISMMITIAIDPYTPATVPIVREREFLAGQSRRPILEKLDEIDSSNVFWSIGGKICSPHPLDVEKLNAVLLERGEPIHIDSEGQFTIGRLRAGSYTLEVTVDGKEPQRFSVQVPSADFDLTIS
ncbi:MAG: DUF4255 domain-containing protein [Chloroflexi bacterium]|nr:MAG: DUF4255 domain-containing protein [Chloroflexota bacterium]